MEHVDTKTTGLTMERVTRYFKEKVESGAETVSLSEAGRALNVHPMTIRNWLHGGWGKRNRPALCAAIGLKDIALDKATRTGQHLRFVRPTPETPA